jgi:hypothetical protein
MVKGFVFTIFTIAPGAGVPVGVPVPKGCATNSHCVLLNPLVQEMVAEVLVIEPGVTVG